MDHGAGFGEAPCLPLKLNQSWRVDWFRRHICLWNWINHGAWIGQAPCLPLKWHQSWRVVRNSAWIASLSGCLLVSPFGRLRTTRYSNVHRTFSLYARALLGFKSLPFYSYKKRHPIRMSLFVWCAMRDLNPHGLPLEPKSSASANSANRAYMVTPPRIELGLPPWKGGVLTAWPWSHIFKKPATSI